MPIKIANDLPVRKQLEEENIFVMDEARAVSQNIRPLEIVILNLMPLKEATELALLRSLSNTPLQVNITFMRTESYESKNAAKSHLDQFYVTIEQIRDRYYDGMIITGAPVEDITFEEVDYWEEMCDIMDWAETHVTSTLHICWGAQAGLYHYYGIDKQKLPQKLFGIYEHKVANRRIPLVRGFDDVFLAPHSRHTESPRDAIHACRDLTVLAESDAAGVFLAIAEDGKKIFVNGHQILQILFRIMGCCGMVRSTAAHGLGLSGIFKNGFDIMGQHIGSRRLINKPLFCVGHQVCHTTHMGRHAGHTQNHGLTQGIG